MFDCIIVGSGFAGAYLAGLLKNLDVLIIEKDKKALPKDSGIVSNKLYDFFKSFDDFVKEEIREMNAISPSGLQFSLKSEKPFAYVLDNGSLLEALRRKARENAKYQYETVKKINYFQNCVNVQTEQGSYDGRMVIGCDGALSTVRKSLNIPSPKISAGIMCKAEIQSNVKIYFNKYFSPDFFSWVKNNEYGLVTAIRPAEYFEYFKKNLCLPEGDVTASPIPIGYTKSYAKRALLVGDACGHVKPLTGGGIIFSMSAARHAAIVIKAALKTKRYDENFLKQYEGMWKKDFGHEIRLQLFLRKIYRNLTNKDVDSIFRDFGPHIERIEEFDYDKFTKIWTKLPRLKLLKFAITKFPLAF
ncbi:MAG: NAD(P)/FAD-dependent oxidoreductase [Candidatus Aenigmatarchaeota archaeon]